MSNFAKYCVGGAFFLGIGLCIYFISTGNLSEKEIALLSILLTTLSVLATWIITHIYSQSQHRKAIQEVQESHRSNLRTYALKAAEKVDNLSNQLGQLAAYLEGSLEESDDERLNEALQSKQERIESAIQIINMLKSVNDTALSDWEGVIGDELDERRELQAEREEELRGVIERLDSVSESQVYSQRYTQDSTQALSGEIDSLRKDLRSIALSLGLSPIRRIKSAERMSRRVVESHCPECGEAIEYKQKKSQKSIKKVKCKACNIELISRYDKEKGFILEKRHVAKEQITCPLCKTECEVELDTFPSSSLSVECKNCHAQVMVIRTMQGVTIKTQGIHADAEVLTDEIVELVKNSLPPQPWPTGINKAVAEKLGLPPRLVSEAITKLILLGVCDLQLYGKIYVPKSSVVEKKSKGREIDEG